MIQLRFRCTKVNAEHKGAVEHAGDRKWVEQIVDHDVDMVAEHPRGDDVVPYWDTFKSTAEIQFQRLTSAPLVPGKVYVVTITEEGT